MFFFREIILPKQSKATFRIVDSDFYVKSDFESLNETTNVYYVEEGYKVM